MENGCSVNPQTSQGHYFYKKIFKNFFLYLVCFTSKNENLVSFRKHEPFKISVVNFKKAYYSQLSQFTINGYITVSGELNSRIV